MPNNPALSPGTENGGSSSFLLHWTEVPSVLSWPFCVYLEYPDVALHDNENCAGPLSPSYVLLSAEMTTSSSEPAPVLIIITSILIISAHPLHGNHQEQRVFSRSHDGDLTPSRRPLIMLAFSLFSHFLQSASRDCISSDIGPPYLPFPC